MNEAELLADRLRQRLIPRHPGPDPVAAVAAKIGLSPTAKLRARARSKHREQTQGRAMPLLLVSRYESNSASSHDTITSASDAMTTLPMIPPLMPPL